MSRRVLSILNLKDLEALRTKSELVTFSLDKDTIGLIDDLKKFTITQDGLGMSAVQLGVHKSLFVMRRSRYDKLTVVINPTIVSGTKPKVGPEGCFSISLADRTAAMVKRMNSINVVYDNENGERISSELLGLDAIVFQHEYDHCVGKLMIDPPNFTGWSKF